MLNFAEQTGSGAVMIVWSFLPNYMVVSNMNVCTVFICTTIHPISHFFALSRSMSLPQKHATPGISFGLSQVHTVTASEYVQPILPLN
jgi:hypothetical protein